MRRALRSSASQRILCLAGDGTWLGMLKRDFFCTICSIWAPTGVGPELVAAAKTVLGATGWQALVRTSSLVE